VPIQTRGGGSGDSTSVECLFISKAPTHNKRSGVWVWANGRNGPGYTDKTPYHTMDEGNDPLATEMGECTSLNSMTSGWAVNEEDSMLTWSVLMGCCISSVRSSSDGDASWFSTWRDNRLFGVSR
jgi:hypothetical protein